MKLLIGKEQEAPEPEVRFWLERGTDSVWLVAKHSDDSTHQNVAAIKLNADGEIHIELRRLFTLNLCKALGIDQSEIISAVVEPTREPEGKR